MASARRDQNATPRHPRVTRRRPRPVRCRAAPGTPLPPPPDPLAGHGRFRVNVFLHSRGPGAVLRTIPTTIPSLESLQLPPVLKELCSRERGLVLVTGPTGSGKSTTLAAMVDLINQTWDAHILT